MKALNQIFAATAVSAFAFALTLTGCQGQNPFERNHDPIQEYRESLEGSKPYVPGQENVVPDQPDNTQKFCASPFLVSVENDQGEKLLTFTEDQETTYIVNIRSELSQTDYTIQAQGLPSGASFNQLSHSGTLSSYKFTWKPGKLNSSRDGRALVSLKYINATAQSLCGQNISIGLNLTVDRNDGQPIITISGLPASKIQFGNAGTFKFKVLVDDPASTSSAGPVLEGARFKENSVDGILDGSTGVDCKNVGGQNIGGTKWSFDCSFNSQTIKNTDAILKTGGIADYGFVIVARSTRTGLSTVSSSARVSIEFAKPKTDTTNGGN